MVAKHRDWFSARPCTCSQNKCPTIANHAADPVLKAKYSFRLNSGDIDENLKEIRSEMRKDKDEIMGLLRQVLQEGQHARKTSAEAMAEATIKAELDKNQGFISGPSISTAHRYR